MRGIATEREVGGDADASSLRQRLAIADAVGHELRQAREPARVEGWAAVTGVFDFARLAEEIQPQLQRVLARLSSDFVDEALHDECVGRVRRCPPRTARQTDLVMEVLHAYVVDDAPGEVVDVQFCRKQVLFRHVRAAVVLAATREALCPGNDLAVGIHSCMHFVQAARAVEIVLQIVLARPGELDRPAGLLRDECGFEDIVVGQAASEATTDARHLDLDVFARNTGRCVCGAGGPRRHLRRRDDVAALVLDVRVTVLRFERRVRDERHAIASRHRGRGVGHCCIEVAVVENDLALGFEHRLVLFPEAFAAVVRVRALVPLDVKGVAALECRPGRGRDDGDPARQYEVGLTGRRPLDREYVEDAVDLSCLRVIERLDLCIEDRGPRNHGMTHIGLHGVDAVLRLARDDLASIDGLAIGADDAMVFDSLERRRILGRVQGGCVLDQFAVREFRSER